MVSKVRSPPRSRYGGLLFWQIAMSMCVGRARRVLSYATTAHAERASSESDLQVCILTSLSYPVGPSLHSELGIEFRRPWIRRSSMSSCGRAFKRTAPGFKQACKMYRMHPRLAVICLLLFDKTDPSLSLTPTSEPLTSLAISSSPL